MLAVGSTTGGFPQILGLRPVRLLKKFQPLSSFSSDAGSHAYDFQTALSKDPLIANTFNSIGLDICAQDELVW